MVPALALIVALSGCRSSEKPSQPLTPRRERAEKVSAPPPPTATLKVTVRAAGPLPEKLKSAGPCGVAPPTVGADGALADVAVWVNQVVSTPIPAAGSVALSGCALEPPLLMLTPGSAVSVRNPGKVAREIRVFAAGAAPDAAPFSSRALPPGGVAGLTVPRDGLAAISCVGEPCEGAVVVGAAGHLTDPTGHALVRGVSGGDVTVYAYHPALGQVEGKVTTQLGATAELTLTLPAPSPSPSP